MPPLSSFNEPRRSVLATLSLIVCLCCPSAAQARPKPAPFHSEVVSGQLEPEGAPVMPPYSSNDHFTFAVMGDSAPPAPGGFSPRGLFEIFDDIGVLRPDILFHTGNFIWAKTGDLDGTQKQVSRFQSFTSGIGIPMFIAPGPKDAPDDESHVVFRKSVAGSHTWRSFNYGNSHFIVLDTEVPGSVGKIGGEQLTWLQQDLDGRTNSAHTFVFLNRDPYPIVETPDAGFASPADRDAFVAMMSKSQVTTVFSGSLPVYSAEAHDGVNYVNTGGAGGPSTILPTQGGFLHYVLVTIERDAVTVTPIQPLRIDIIASSEVLGVAQVYNLSGTPLVFSHVGIMVPSRWRSKKPGLVGAERLSLYDVTAKASSSDGDKMVDVAPVDIEPANPTDPLEKDFDMLYLRVQVPAASVVEVTVHPPAR